MSMTMNTSDWATLAVELENQARQARAMRDLHNVLCRLPLGYETVQKISQLVSDDLEKFEREVSLTRAQKVA